MTIGDDYARATQLLAEGSMERQQELSRRMVFSGGCEGCIGEPRLETDAERDQRIASMDRLREAFARSDPDWRKRADAIMDPCCYGSPAQKFTYHLKRFWLNVRALIGGYRRPF